jgi:UDP-N-acetylglucosamine acyltransferase
VNAEGLKRRGFTPEMIAAVRAAYKTVFRNNLTLKDAIATLIAEQQTHSSEVQSVITPLLDFLQSPGRGLAR